MRHIYGARRVAFKHNIHSYKYSLSTEHSMPEYDKLAQLPIQQSAGREPRGCLVPDDNVSERMVARFLDFIVDRPRDIPGLLQKVTDDQRPRGFQRILLSGANLAPVMLYSYTP